MSVVCHFLIIGGGISGCSCVEELLSSVKTNFKILMVSNSSSLKLPVSLMSLGRCMDELSVNEQPWDTFNRNYENFSFINDLIVSINPEDKIARTKLNLKITFERCIICSGALSRNPYSDVPLVYTLRDIDSIDTFKCAISKSKRICIVGNGGIALELLFEIESCEIYLVSRNDYLGTKFFDEETSQFFTNYMAYIKLPGGELPENLKKCEERPYIKQGIVSNCSPDLIDSKISGGAVGPDWSRKFKLSGKNNMSSFPNNIKTFFASNISSVKYKESSEPWLQITLSDSTSFSCDCLIMATGVEPNTNISLLGNQKFEISECGDYLVDSNMMTSVKDIYAAGDCCFPKFALKNHDDGSPSLWFKLNTWYQAKYMGIYAACCASGCNQMIPIQFDLFTHVTRFFSFKVCLLGLYNGQNIPKTELTFYKRYNKVDEFIRLVIYKNRIVGAVLIGETEIEETIENLILNEMDISALGEDIINPDIDIADYFD